MTSSLKSHRAVADPRILNVQVERAANTLSGSLVASPVWALVAALVCSEFFPHLGAVPLAYGVGFVVIMSCAVLGLRGALAVFYRERRAGMDTEADARWLGRLLILNVVLSAVWGLAPWMLWSDENPLNHVFIELICLAAVAQFLVNRANHVSFFLASFLPMAALLFARCIMAGSTVDLILAAVVVLYAIQVVLIRAKSASVGIRKRRPGSRMKTFRASSKRRATKRCSSAPKRKLPTRRRRRFSPISATSSGRP